MTLFQKKWVEKEVKREIWVLQRVKNKSKNTQSGLISNVKHSKKVRCHQRYFKTQWCVWKLSFHIAYRLSQIKAKTLKPLLRWCWLWRPGETNAAWDRSFNQHWSCQYKTKLAINCLQYMRRNKVCCFQKNQINQNKKTLKYLVLPVCFPFFTAVLWTLLSCTALMCSLQLQNRKYNPQDFLGLECLASHIPHVKLWWQLG